MAFIHAATTAHSFLVGVAAAHIFLWAFQYFHTSLEAAASAASRLVALYTQYLCSKRLAHTAKVASCFCFVCVDAQAWLS